MFFAQFEQDKYLEHNVFKGFKGGVFMDIGAHDGISFNNTLYFERTNGWSGVNVEPIKDVFDKLVINRPTSINLNCAVCNTDGTAEFLCNTGYTEMLSGLTTCYDKRHIGRIKEELQCNGGSSTVIDVFTKKIETICDMYNIKHIHFMTIDVEGAEFDVIRSINFEKVFIDVILFENNFTNVSIPIVEYLQTKNYKILYAESYDIYMIHVDSCFRS